MTDSLQQDADDLLHWLNAHSVSISDGLPITLMQAKWTATKRTHEQLKTSLEWLFGSGLVAMTPGVNPPHVRLSVKGFQQLLAGMDAARSAPSPAPAVAPVMAAAAPPLPAPAAGGSAFKPGLNMATPTAAAAAIVAAPSAAAVVAPVVAAEAAPATRFVDPAKPPTEIGLRNQVLMIFRDLKLAAGQQLIAMTLTRYWQEMGLRGEHLRVGIDVMLRDGYLEMTVKRYENYWMLTPAGHAYLSAPVTSPALLALAQPMTQIGDGYKDEELRRKGLALFKQASAQPFSALESAWRLHRDALIHALDLLCKSGDLALADGSTQHFSLTPQGAARRR